MDDLSKQLERRLTQLQAQRQPSEHIWKDVFDYMAPERALGWFTDTIDAAGATANQRARLYDSTAIDAYEVLKSNLASWMTPENSRWFALDAGQDDEQATAWMDGAAQFIFEHICAAGFSAVTNECYSDLVAGWFVLYIDEAKDERGAPAGGYNFEQWPMHQCHVATSKPAGRVDTIYRVWWATVEQMVTDYGYDQVSEETRKKYDDGKLADKVEMLWSIEPRTKTSRGYGKLAKNKPFRSCHMERGTKKIVRESGYDEFPCAVPRWRLIPGTPYATGIGSNVLPDVKTLNEIKKLELSSLDIAVSGMWKAADDGVLNPKTIKIGPRKVVMMADPSNNMLPLETGADFNVSFTKCDQLQQSIRRTLMADMLTPVGGPVRSATEIATNTNQIRQLMAPILGRLQSEFLQVVVERCFNLAYRAGALVAHLGQLPDSLAQSGGSYSVKYISPLARSQKMEEVIAIDQHVAGLVALATTTQDLTVLDGIKLDDANYEKGLALGVPAKLLRGPDELLDKREMDAKNRKAAEQAAQQQELGQMAAAKGIEAAVAA